MAGWKDILMDVLKLTDEVKRLNQSPVEEADPEGRKLPPLTNPGMGYVFEERLEQTE